MAKRGRKSKASLTVLPAVTELVQRPAPPKTLDKVGRGRWFDIVDVLPADYFRPSDLLLLEDMIRQENYVRDCDALIKKHGRLVKNAQGGLWANPVVHQRRGHVASILSIQRALRLPPSTRLDKGAAALRPAAPGKKKPWESST